MSPPRLLALTALAMLAFAGNSLLCRLALTQGGIDPASFTTIRLTSGAIVLWLLARSRRGASGHGNWLSALALFIYAAGFSYAYVNLSAASGALLLFGAVQATMFGYGLARGERLARWQCFGLLLAIAGLIILLLPGLTAPPLMASLWMLAAGVAWGSYSLRGRSGGDAVRVTAGNFLRALPIALALSLLTVKDASVDALGIAYAAASGALASGWGYAIWYSVLPDMRASVAASVQLSVPVIAAFGGILFLDEPMSARLALAAAAILGGVALVIRGASLNSQPPVR